MELNIQLFITLGRSISGKKLGMIYEAILDGRVMARKNTGQKYADILTRRVKLYRQYIRGCGWMVN